MQTVVGNLERLEDVPPVLALVVEPLVDHVHDFVELGRPDGEQAREPSASADPRRLGHGAATPHHALPLPVLLTS